MSNTVFYGFIAAFLSGVALADLFTVNIYFVWLLGLIGASILLLPTARRFYLLIVFSFCLMSSILGVIWFNWQDDEPSSVSDYLDQEVLLVGTISTVPDEREKSTMLTVDIDRVQSFSPIHRERVLVITERFPKYQYGEQIMVSGELKKPENFETDTGREFDYVSFLAKDDIYYSILFPEVVTQGSDYGHPVKSALFTARDKFLNSLQSVIPEPHVSLLGGILVGAKESLGKDLQDLFRRTGIIHIVVLSGYNVTIVAEAIMRTVSFLPRFAGLATGASSIVLFAILTGAGATIVRASIMALLVLLARATGRSYAITRALFIAALAMVMHNPDILLHDPSFQLSFLASIGLIHLSPIVERWFTWLPEKFALRTLAAATVSTQIFVLPLLLHMTGEFSLVALPVNLLVLPAIPITMLFGFLTGLAALFVPLLTFLFSYITIGLLSYTFAVVYWFGSWSHAAIVLPGFSFALVVLAYIGLTWIVVRRSDAGAD